jgi:hypothetical protein
MQGLADAASACLLCIMARLGAVSMSAPGTRCKRASNSGNEHVRYRTIQDLDLEGRLTCSHNGCSSDCCSNGVANRHRCHFATRTVSSSSYPKDRVQIYRLFKGGGQGIKFRTACRKKLNGALGQAGAPTPLTPVIARTDTFMML